MENIQFIFPSEEELKTNDFSIEEKASGNFKSYKVNNYSELVVLTDKVNLLPTNKVVSHFYLLSIVNQEMRF